MPKVISFCKTKYWGNCEGIQKKIVRGIKIKIGTWTLHLTMQISPWNIAKKKREWIFLKSLNSMLEALIIVNQLI